MATTNSIERFHVTSQSRENHTGGHFGVQLNGDLVCCKMRMQNAVQTWQLMDLPHKYVRYRYPVHVICEMWAHWLHSSRLSHTSSYLLVHQGGRHAQKYHGVIQTYIIFNHVMKTLYRSSPGVHPGNKVHNPQTVCIMCNTAQKNSTTQLQHTGDFTYCHWQLT